jgi:hypothetical protein
MLKLQAVTEGSLKDKIIFSAIMGIVPETGLIRRTFRYLGIRLRT